MKISCPNDGCDEELERCDISQHRQMCLFELVCCKYTNIGCMEKVFRSNLEEHQNDSQQHLQLAIDTVNQQQMTTKTLEEKVAQIQSNLMKFRITNFDKCKASNEAVYSPAFYTSPGGYKMCINVECNGYGDGKGTHVSVYAYLMRGENDNHLPWPFTGTVTVELLNQLEDDNHLTQYIALPPDDESSQRVLNAERSSSGYGTAQCIPHSDLGYNAAENCQYLKNDCLHFRVNYKFDAKSAYKPWLV